MGQAKAAGGILTAWTLKYFDKITSTQAQSNDEDSSAEGAFDFDDLGVDRFWSPLTRRLWLWASGIAFSFFRAYWPIAKFGRLFIITRDADVRYVLTKPDVFGVPYGPEMTELGGGATFVLGLEGSAQKHQHELIAGLIRAGDTDWLIERSRQIADTLIDASGGRIDVMKDLIARVTAETCAEYFGLTIDDPDAFAEWAMSISALLFADPFGKPATRRLALAGAARVRSVIDAALTRLSLGGPNPPEGLDGTILERLVRTGVSNGEVRAIMVGMITGFIPTTTLAAGNIIEQLLRTRDGLSAPIKAAIKARENDEAARAQLEQLLFEAARLDPALNPGQWRYAFQGGSVGAGPAPRQIPKGSVLLVATASAMRDRAPPSYELVFGSGVHACLGRTLAMAQITAIFECLLSQPGLRVSSDRWGRIFRVGVFPRRLDMEFKPVSGPRTQSVVTVLAPLAAGADLNTWSDAIGKLGTPAAPGIEAALMETGVIRFASLNAIELGDTGAPAPHLLLEVNGDGDAESLMDAVEAGARQWLLPLFGSAAAGARIPGAAEHGRTLGELLRASALDLKARPWGTTGLCFYGLPGQSAASIERQADLAQFCRDAVDYFVKLHAGLGSHAATVLQFVRGLIRGDPKLEKMAEGDKTLPLKRDLQELLDRGRVFRRDLTIPSRQEPQTIAWKAPDNRVRAFASSPTLRWTYGGLALVALGVSVLCFNWLGFWPSFTWRDPVTSIGRCLIALVAGCFGTATLVGLGVGGFAWTLHRADQNDRPQDFEPNLGKVRDIAQRENRPGYAQNHFLSVSPLKPGWFRKFTLGLALWGIEIVVDRVFRPGFILNMGTIHFARWFRPPGSERLIFLSNYDGSWDSYLEDFITKAHQGQSAAWSNAIGFPRTQWLINGGAQDGDRFKRWVRRQQQPTQFWFNRFPTLTADQMRNNAVICWELARASTDSQARAWLSYFGSMPKTDSELETPEVQAIVFRGFKRLTHMKFAAIRLPEDRTACAAWLKSLVPDQDPHASGGGHDLATQSGALEVTFGDRPLSGDEERSATCVAFTAQGLSHLRLPAADGCGTVATFPTAFNLGMSSRQRILGDDSSTEPWRWADAAGDTPVHAALLLYAGSKQACDDLFAQHFQKLPGASKVYDLDTQPTRPSERGFIYEHFGFRDGISQPVIRGTQRVARGADRGDIMEPGEFILGYKSNQGYYPPTPVVSRENDAKNRLGSIPNSAETRFSAFVDLRPQVRDFGRNGSFLAIRQFEQHVDAFHAHAKSCAEQLQDVAGLQDLVGGVITAEWVEAKMMGRWHDGVPLIDRPIASVPKTAEQAVEIHAGAADNHAPRPRAKPAHPGGPRRYDADMDFGVDDPQGLYCPFGAHIRRANPRGSLAPGDTSQLTITNRHRLLRRGRSYEKGDEKGLLFVGLCADLERQFEFIQQSWLGAPGFAGLTNEPDPVVSLKPDGSSTRFTIPTSAGSLSLKGGQNFVAVHGGGYFFLPSRSAFLFLADLNA